MDWSKDIFPMFVNEAAYYEQGTLPPSRPPPLPSPPSVHRRSALESLLALAPCRLTALRTHCQMHAGWEGAPELEAGAAGLRRAHL